MALTNEENVSICLEANICTFEHADQAWIGANILLPFKTGIKEKNTFLNIYFWFYFENHYEPALQLAALVLCSYQNRQLIQALNNLEPI